MKQLLLFISACLTVHAISKPNFNIPNEEFYNECVQRTFLDSLRDQKIEQAAEKLTGEELVDYVNRKQTFWKAKINKKFESYSNRVKYGLMGVQQLALTADDRKNLSPTRFLNSQIPSEFDARITWAKCKSIRTIRDQSSCGSCWAFGAVEAMSDRVCIASESKIQVSLSADDLLSCCKTCGFGCEGGNPILAWRYWVKSGIVTGSNFTLAQGCKPYPFPPCEHHSNKTHYSPCKHDLYPTPKCEKNCVSTYTDKSYAEDKYYGDSYYAVEDHEASIQREIMMHGPVEASFEVYEDFLSYVSGVYKRTAGMFHGGHAVKIIGWGYESEIPYWIAANSWNEDWGEDGFFRILRGVDECGIESGIVAGIPKLRK